MSVIKGEVRASDAPDSAGAGVQAAQDAATALALSGDEGQGSCAGLGKDWIRMERAYLDGGLLRRRALEALGAVCGGCPLVAACAKWAVAEQYSGLAAGQAWVNGHEDRRTTRRKGVVVDVLTGGRRDDDRRQQQSA